MKKTYITPVSKSLELYAEQMLAASINTSGTEVDGAEAWTYKKLWGAQSIWTEEEDR